MKHTVSEIELKSGARGLLIDVPGTSVVNMEFSFLSGFDFVSLDKYEVPHLMEHLVLGANERFKSAKLFSREVSLNGAFHNAHTNSYLNSYVAVAAEFEWNRVMELMLIGLTSPRFLPSEFKSERATVIEELYSRLKEVDLKLATAIWRASGNDHALPLNKRIKIMDNITRADIVRYYQQTHNAQNMRFIVAGNIRGKRAQIINLLNRYTQRLPSGERKVLPQYSLISPLGPVKVKEKSDKIFFSINSLRYGKLTDRERQALSILSMILTGAWDSRIFGKGRSKGLIYHISSGTTRQSNMFAFHLYGSVVPGKQQLLFKFIASELSRLKKNGVKAGELKRAKQFLLGLFQINYQTTQSLVGFYSSYHTDDRFIRFDDVPELIKSITRRDVERLVEKIFASDAAAAYGVLYTKPELPGEELDQQVAGLWG